MDFHRSDSLMTESDMEKIEIFISARNLPNLDTLSLTDSYVEVYLEEPGKGRRIVRKTSIVWNDLNPDYKETIVIQYVFEGNHRGDTVRQILSFLVYHEGKPPILIGNVSATVGEIFGMGARGVVKSLTNAERGLRKEGEFGELHLVSESLQGNSEKLFIDFELIGHDLPVPWFSCFGDDSFYVKFIRERDGRARMMHQTQSRNKAHCNFGRMKINLARACGNRVDFPIKIQLVQESNSGPKVVGSGEVSLQMLREGDRMIRLTKGSSVVCRLEFSHLKEWVEYNFMEFISSGLQLALMIGIDFTGSNEDDTEPTSLHFTGRGPSPYELALSEVAKILLDYDSDKLVPVFGFGAKTRFPNLNSRNKAEHCFPMNGDVTNPSLYELEGILRAYREHKSTLIFSGPTLFSPIIENCMREAARAKEEGGEYFILLILTDGQIDDYGRVCDLLVACGRLPLSIVIVGIGKGPWELMEKIDDDDCQMTDSSGRPTERDLVQFVEFNKFKGNGIDLAREVLAELPTQVEEYHRLINRLPPFYHRFKPPVISDAELQARTKRSKASYDSSKFR